MSVKLQMHDQEFLALVAQAASAGIMRATVFFHSQAQLALNVPNTGVRVSAESVKKQAAAQLGSRSKGLIKVNHTRKWNENGVKKKEDVSAWFHFDQDNFADRIDKTGKVRQVKSVTIYPYPSQPGEPPRKRTGWLQRHVIMEFDNQKVGNNTLTASRTGVGKNAMYGLYAELGTRHMKARPWLVATLLKHKAMIGQLLAAKS